MAGLCLSNHKAAYTHPTCQLKLVVPTEKLSERLLGFIHPLYCSRVQALATVTTVQVAHRRTHAQSAGELHPLRRKAPSHEPAQHRMARGGGTPAM
jgi:hypothetical protein